MGKKIIVAGLGHGGIAAAALIAKAGFDVTVYEQKSEGTLGYDWTDIFAPNALSIAGMDMPPADKFEYKEDMTFFNPSMTTALRQNVPKDQLQIKMERRDIRALLPLRLLTGLLKKLSGALNTAQQLTVRQLLLTLQITHTST